MNTRKHTKLVHVGKYAAEVVIEIIDSEDGWSPYISRDDALKLDRVREALLAGDLVAASQYGKGMKGILKKCRERPECKADGAEKPESRKLSG